LSKKNSSEFPAWIEFQGADKEQIKETRKHYDGA
jgi:hypothetical protein